jgi:AAA15 family ATPase/GTPase
MMIEFIVGNFRSIKDPVTLSMVAAKRVAKDKSIDAANTFTVDNRLTLLKSAAIYGANASGKTNLIQAVQFMRDFVLTFSRGIQIKETIPVQKFRLSTETERKPSFFQMVFLLNGDKYRYGFEVTHERVMAEWLFTVPASKEVRLFQRVRDKFTISESFKEGREIEERTRPNTLFLSVVAQFNGPISNSIIKWFRDLSINFGIDNQGALSEATSLFRHSEDKEAVLRLIKDLDLGITDIKTEQLSIPWPAGDNLKELLAEIVRRSGNELPEEVTRIRTVHPKYDADGNVTEKPVMFDLAVQESAGTRRLFSLALPIVNALKEGNTLFIDEIDARLHPLITCAIIGLFNSNNSNSKNAQLIFTTHDTSLLSPKRFRRDQIWFVEKDNLGASHLYSLADYHVRNDASYNQDYIHGRYGAIPFIASDLAWIVDGDSVKV